MKKSKDNIFIIIFSIILFIVGISFLIYFLKYYNIKLITIITIVFVLVVIGLILYIPYKIAEKRKQLINELFILDISSKNNNDEHIRITEKNTLFKYKNVINYYYIFPKIFISFSLRGKLWETPTYKIFRKNELSIQELNEIIERIEKLNNNENENIVVNYKGKKKFVNSVEINKIFENYFIKI